MSDSVFIQTKPGPPPGAAGDAILVLVFCWTEATRTGGVNIGPTLTRGVICRMTALSTPTRERSETLAYGRPATILRAVAWPTPGKVSSTASGALFISIKPLGAEDFLLDLVRAARLVANKTASTHIARNCLIRAGLIMRAPNQHIGHFRRKHGLYHGIVSEAALPVHPVTPPKKVPKPKNAVERKARLEKILNELDRLFPQANCALHHRNAWELLAATILSAQCTDERVNKVTPGLFQKYPTIADMAAASQDELANDIRSTGFFNNKAKSLIGAAQRIMTEFHGEVPRTMEQLLTVPGAARKTANVVLGTGFQIADGVVVDTHVQRISQRLDLTKNDDPGKIEQDLMKIIPRERWILFAHQVILFGRQICVARKPRCAECPLDSVCYAKDKSLA